MAVLATIIVLGVLIFVHELGHFWAAKAVGIGVERFSIGLGPRVAGFTRGETEYVLSAIPLGGYVKMSGMDDEVMEKIEGGGPTTERVKTDRDFDSKPVWARAVVISAGVIMNMLFAFATYAAVAAYWGDAAPATNRVGEVRAEILPAGTAELASVPAGSEVLRIGDRPIENWGDVERALFELPSGPTTIALGSPTDEIQISLPQAAEAREQLYLSLEFWLEPAFSVVNPRSPADRAGIEPGDRVLTVDGREVRVWGDFVEVIQARPGMETDLEILRDGEVLAVTVVPDAAEQIDPRTGQPRTVGQIGVLQAIDEVVYSRVGPLEAMRIGWDRTVFTTRLILGFLRDLVTGGVSPRSVGSIVTIGEASGQAADQGMDVFLSFMALFSVNLAILNLLPIPVLDGGHLVFLAIEAVRGRALSVEQRMRFSQVGFFVIIGIMLWALSNDFMRLFGL